MASLRKSVLATGVAVLLGTSLAPGSGASASPARPTSSPPVECTAPEPGGPVWVTAGCVDPQFAHPVIDSETDLTAPVAHRKVAGHFEGTDVRFSIHLPPKRQWDGRFFQLVYPLQDENASAETISFGADSGAYTVQTNGGSGYRADAAAAKFSETVAAAYYRSRGRPIHGYVYGASGGSYQTIGAMENSTGVWDGAVPMVVGTPTSIPNNFFVRAFARFVLEDDAPGIADAVAPGGSGDPYAGLEPVERDVLREVTGMGVPLRAWEDWRYVLGLDDPEGLLGFAGAVQAMDPTYAADFWTRPGYLGTEQSPLGDLFRAARTAGNEWSLALLTYHRHQVPADLSFHAFDQFRGPDGQPLYPQRPVEVGSIISRSVTGGGTHTGRFDGRVIMVENLLDTDAFPWHGDWYRGRVRQALGRRADDHLRVWYQDNADHLIGPVDPARTRRLVDWSGVYQQALRDVAAWAERGVAPPRSSRYEVDDSQVAVPASAGARRGIQPVVDLTVAGAGADADRVDVAAGQSVTFRARITVPPHAGRVVAAEWDLAGTGSFTPVAIGRSRQTVEVRATFTYTTPGTYFPVLRATAQRDGDPDAPYARVQNLGRVRVVVH